MLRRLCRFILKGKFGSVEGSLKTIHFEAIEHNHLHILQWLFSLRHKCPIRVLGVESCRLAAQFGRLAILQWLRSSEWDPLRDPPCPWNESVCATAAYNGQLATLQWLHSNGCPWDKAECIEIAEEEGHTAIAEWIRAHP